MISRKFIFLWMFYFSFYLLGCSSLKLTQEEINSPNLLFDKARQLYLVKDYKKSINAYQKFIDLYPQEIYEMSWSYYGIGLSYYLLKDYKKSRHYFVELLQLYPIPRAPRTLAIKLIRKIDQGNSIRRTSY